MKQTAPRVSDNPQADRFEIFLDDKQVGFATYKRIKAGISLLHTEIDPHFEGRGLGSALVRGVLDAARAAGLRVLPFCPFIRGYIQRHPEYLELVPAERRTRFDLPAETQAPNSA